MVHVRDFIIIKLYENLNAWQMSQLLLTDVCDPPRESGYIPVKKSITFGSKTIPLDDALRTCIDEYINSEDLEGGTLQPFLDYRTDTGYLMCLSSSSYWPSLFSQCKNRKRNSLPSTASRHWKKRRRHKLGHNKIILSKSQKQKFSDVDIFSPCGIISPT